MTDRRPVLKFIRRHELPAFVFLLLGSVLMVFPFVWMVLSSFKSPADVYKYPPKWLPSKFGPENFVEVFHKIPFLLFYFNSIITSSVQTLLQIFVSVTGGYAFAKLDFPGRKKLYSFMQSSMFVPEAVMMIPLFLIVATAQLVNTYPGLILPQIASAFTTILLFSFFQSIPSDLIDAAKIDGCGYYRILSRVVLPNSRTAIGTAALFAFLTHWRSYLWPLIVTNGVQIRTLPIGLRYLVQESSSEYQVMMAAALMAIVPVLVVYMLAEKQFVRSITLTGLKS
ncbi:MAG: carbohydrate ABC transporter permease [Spirochaetota bacterium]